MPRAEEGNAAARGANMAKSARDPLAWSAHPLSTARRGARRSERAAGGKPRSHARPTRRRLQPGDFPVVQRRSAGSLVEPRSANGAFHRFVSRIALVAPGGEGGTLRHPRRHGVPAGYRGMRCGRTSGAIRHLDHDGSRRCLLRAARAGLRALGRSVVRRPPGRRPIRRRARPHVLRRVDVRDRAGCLEGRAGPSGGRCCAHASFR